MKENIFATLKPGRTTGHHYTFVKTRPRFRHRRSRQIQIDVVSDEEIKFAVSVIIHEGAARIPAFSIATDASFVGDVSERAVSIVVIKHVLPKIADDEIVPSVVIVVADADTLSPAVVNQTSLRSHIGEGAIAIVLEQM